MKRFYFCIYNYANWKDNTFQGFNAKTQEEAIRVCKLISASAGVPVRLQTIPEHGKEIAEVYHKLRVDNNGIPILN